MRIWLSQHVRTFAATISRFTRSRTASLLNIAVIAVALTLPVGGYVVLGNLQHLARTHGSAPQLSLFLALDASGGDVASVRDRLQQHADVLKFGFVPRAQALRELRASAGLAEVIDSLQQNPLPDAFVVDARESGAENLETLQEEFRKWPKVAHVQLDSAWAKRLDALLRLGKFVLLLLATVLGFGMVTVTFNTIRLQILTQREEIEVSRLIGATDPFIRRPFLYYGAVLGAFSGLAAWVLVWAGANALNRGLSEFGQTYGATLNLQPLTLAESAGVLLFSTWLCWLGAWLSVKQHLAGVDPA